MRERFAACSSNDSYLFDEMCRLWREAADNDS